VDECWNQIFRERYSLLCGREGGGGAREGCRESSCRKSFAQIHSKIRGNTSVCTRFPINMSKCPGTSDEERGEE